MRISLKRLFKLPVETASHEQLGRVVDRILDIEGQMIQQYVVRARPFGRDLLIGRDQIIAITDEHIVVEDRVLGSSEDASRSRVPMPPNINPEAVTIREAQ